MVDLGTPSKSNGRQNAAQNWPRGAKMANKKNWDCFKNAFPKWTAAQNTPETAPGFIYDDLYTLTGLILNDFQWLLAPLPALSCHIRLCCPDKCLQTFSILIYIFESGSTEASKVKTCQGLPRPAKG